MTWLNLDAMGENHYAWCDPAFMCDDDDFFEHEELIENAMMFEIDYDDQETIIDGISDGEMLMCALRDDDYDALDHVSNEILRAKLKLGVS